MEGTLQGFSPANLKKDPQVREGEKKEKRILNVYGRIIRTTYGLWEMY